MMAPTEEHPASGRKLFQRLPIMELGIWFSAGLVFILNGILFGTFRNQSQDAQALGK